LTAGTDHLEAEERANSLYHLGSSDCPELLRSAWRVSLFCWLRRSSGGSGLSCGSLFRLVRGICGSLIRSNGAGKFRSRSRRTRCRMVGRRFFFAARCLSNQFDLPVKHSAVIADEHPAGAKAPLSRQLHAFGGSAITSRNRSDYDIRLFEGNVMAATPGNHWLAGSRALPALPGPVCALPRLRGPWASGLPEALTNTMSALRANWLQPLPKSKPAR